MIQERGDDSGGDEQEMFFFGWPRIGRERQDWGRRILWNAGASHHDIVQSRKLSRTRTVYLVFNCISFIVHREFHLLVAV